MTVLISKREQEILNLIAYENSTKMIAEELCISEHTVITHRKNLLYKLNVKNTAGLIRRAFEVELLKLRKQVAILIFIAIGLCHFEAIHAQCDSSDFVALKALYNSTVGDSWDNNTGWSVIRDSLTCPTGFNLEDAYGVGVDITGRVDSIRLRNNKLSGVINDSLALLSHLRTINLSKNNIAGSIPDDLGSISTLEELLLHQNSISGGIITTGFPVLRVYSVNDNNLSGGIPPQLIQLDSLEELWLSDNDLGGSGIDDLTYELGFMESLKVFRIDGNGLGGCFPTSLKNLCSQLTNVNIDAGNSFDALWEDFCSAGDGMCSDCSVDPVYWTGLISEDWHEPMNWAYGCVPQENNEVIIELGNSVEIKKNNTGLAAHVFVSDKIERLVIQGSLIVVGKNENEEEKAGGENDYGLTCEALLINTGLLHVKNQEVGIYTIDTIVNFGTIQIDSVDQGIDTYDGLIANFGDILIDHTYRDAMKLYVSSLINDGLITIDNVYIGLYSSSSSIHNIDTIMITNADEGIYYSNHLNTMDTFQNEGIIKIDSMSITGIEINSGIMVNSGSIAIDETGDVGIYLSGGTLINDDSISIRNTDGTGLGTSNGRRDSSLFVNNNWVEISDAFDGLYLDENNRLKNSGELHLFDLSQDGLILNTSTVDNTGQIIIDAVGKDGLFMDSDDPDGCIFNNHSSLSISNTVQNGINLQIDSKFVNESTGDLQLQSIGGTGLLMVLSEFENIDGASFNIANSLGDMLDIGIDCTFSAYHTLDIVD